MQEFETAREELRNRASEEYNVLKIQLEGQIEELERTIEAAHQVSVPGVSLSGLSNPHEYPGIAPDALRSAEMPGAQHACSIQLSLVRTGLDGAHRHRVALQASKLL